jgi:c-di-GMP-binding flagellar brake protein YcgR
VRTAIEVGEGSSSVSELPIKQASNVARPPMRRYARAAVSLPVRYTLQDESEAHQGEIINLGGGGLRLLSVLDLARGEMITLHFSLPDMEREVVVRAKVVLSFFEASSSQYAHGVAFAQISIDDQKRIVSYVESIQHVNADM